MSKLLHLILIEPSPEPFGYTLNWKATKHYKQKRRLMAFNIAPTDNIVESIRTPVACMSYCVDQHGIQSVQFGRMLLRLVVAAQLAAKYARQGTVVYHLVLIGSPISQSFLGMLRDITDIRKVVVIDLDEHGGPIYAGMSVIELFMELPLLASQMPDSEGHFYYAEPSEVGNERRRKLAEELYRVGVR